MIVQMRLFFCYFLIPLYFESPKCSFQRSCFQSNLCYRYFQYKIGIIIVSDSKNMHFVFFYFCIVLQIAIWQINRQIICDRKSLIQNNFFLPSPTIFNDFTVFSLIFSFGKIKSSSSSFTIINSAS